MEIKKKEEQMKRYEDSIKQKELYVVRFDHLRTLSININAKNIEVISSIQKAQLKIILLFSCYLGLENQIKLCFKEQANIYKFKLTRSDIRNQRDKDDIENTIKNSLTQHQKFPPYSKDIEINGVISILRFLFASEVSPYQLYPHYPATRGILDSYIEIIQQIWNAFDNHFADTQNIQQKVIYQSIEILSNILREKKNYKKENQIDIVDILLYFTSEAVLNNFQSIKDEDKLKSDIALTIQKSKQLSDWMNEIEQDKTNKLFKNNEKVIKLLNMDLQEKIIAKL